MCCLARVESAPAALPRPSDTLRVGMVAALNSYCRLTPASSASPPRDSSAHARRGISARRRRPARPELERQAAALNLSDRVIFLGDRRDIPAVLASMEVAVLTSDSESLSNAILEAMAARLPVVAYNVGGDAELVNAAARALIAPKNEDDFANAIQRLLGAIRLESLRICPFSTGP